MRRMLPLVLLASCATSLPPAAWFDPATLPPADRFPEAPAVVLYRHRELLMLTGREPKDVRTQERFHEVVAIRTEKGIDLAQGQIAVPSEAKLIELKARQRDPDGTVRPLPQSSMFEQAVQDPEGGGTLRRFRFPDVRVGSVIEFVWTIQEEEALPGYEWQSAADPLPVSRYDLDLTFGEGINSEVSVYNEAAGLEQTRDGAATHLHWHADDVPAREDEPYAPHWTFSEPWWAFRITAFRVGSTRISGNESWDAAARFWLPRIYGKDEKVWRNFDARIPTSGCADKACIVQRAADFVAEHTDFEGPGSFLGVRPMSEVLAGARATGFEQALLLRRLLADAGVEARVAALVVPASRAWDRKVPAMRYFNHLLVEVPARAGVRKTWIDPSCAHCRPGQLPWWSRGVPALVIDRVPESQFYPEEANAGFDRPAGEPAVADTDHRTLHVRVDPSGDAQVDVSLETAGAGAMAERRRFGAGSAEEWAQFAGEFATRRAPTAQLTTPGKLQCDKRAGACKASFAFRAPGFATVDGDELLVPLSILSTDYDRAFLKETRRDDVAVQKPGQTLETVQVDVAGYVLASTHSPRSSSSEAFDMSWRVNPASNGAEVVRDITARVGIYPKASYAGLRKVVRDYAAAREQVLTFRKIH